MFATLRKKGDSQIALSEVLQEMGVKTRIHTDNTKEIHLGLWREVFDKHGGINTSTTEQNSPCKNRAGKRVKEAKRKDVRLKNNDGAPRTLCKFAMVYSEELIFLTAFPNNQLRGRTPHEFLTGDTPSILPYL